MTKNRRAKQRTRKAATEAGTGYTAALRAADRPTDRPAVIDYLPLHPPVSNAEGHDMLRKLQAASHPVVALLRAHAWKHTATTHCACGFRVTHAQLAVIGHHKHVAGILVSSPETSYTADDRSAIERALGDHQWHQTNRTDCYCGFKTPTALDPAETWLHHLTGMIRNEVEAARHPQPVPTPDAPVARPEPHHLVVELVSPESHFNKPLTDIDPEALARYRAHPEHAFTIECPGLTSSCMGWEECGHVECNELMTDEKYDEMEDTGMNHGVYHQHMWFGWSVAVGGCSLVSFADAWQDSAHDLDLPPGRYPVDFDWTEDYCDLFPLLDPCGQCGAPVDRWLRNRSHGTHLPVCSADPTHNALPAQQS